MIAMKLPIVSEPTGRQTLINKHIGWLIVFIHEQGAKFDQYWTFFYWKLIMLNIRMVVQGILVLEGLVLCFLMLSARNCPINIVTLPFFSKYCEAITLLIRA